MQGCPDLKKLQAVQAALADILSEITHYFEDIFLVFTDTHIYVHPRCESRIFEDIVKL